MSFDQPADFQAESEALAALLEPIADADFDRPTQFKDWAIRDVVAHLHLFCYPYFTSLQRAVGMTFTTGPSNTPADMQPPDPRQTAWRRYGCAYPTS